MGCLLRIYRPIKAFHLGSLIIAIELIPSIFSRGAPSPTPAATRFGGVFIERGPPFRPVLR
jgi:hypothetical protein